PHTPLLRRRRLVYLLSCDDTITWVRCVGRAKNALEKIRGSPSEGCGMCVHVQRRSLPHRSMTLLSMDQVIPALERVAALLLIAGLSFSAACLTIKRRSIFFT